MKESSKSIARRIKDPRFITRYIVGSGMDIGGKPDPLSLHRAVFPLMTQLKVWDLEDGDAQYMESVLDESLDFVYSSHTLEHMVDPHIALKNWFRIIKPGGHLVISIPDEDLYEQGDFDQKYNKHHKHTFTIFKQKSWSKVSINVVDLVQSLDANAQLCFINLEDTHYRYDLPRFDQTRAPMIESAIEFIVRKRTAQELVDYGRIHKEAGWDDVDRLHFTQYFYDQRAAAESYPEPFGETK